MAARQDSKGLKATASAHITRASLLSANGRAEEARQELQRAIEGAHRGSGPVEIAHAHLGLSTAAHGAGDGAAARRHLQDARSVALACPDPGPVITRLLHRVEARSVGPRRVTQPPAPLAADFSERELTVLRLLSSALSQREIGRFCSRSTTGNTFQDHLRKLAWDSRLCSRPPRRYT